MRPKNPLLSIRLRVPVAKIRRDELVFSFETRRHLRVAVVESVDLAKFCNTGPVGRAAARRRGGARRRLTLVLGCGFTRVA